MKHCTVLLLAGVLNTANADVETAKQYYAQGRLEAAIGELEPLAKQGDAWAENLLGQIYLLGHGVPRNLDLAEYWLNKSAAAGNRDAQYNLGQLAAARRDFKPDSNASSDTAAVRDKAGAIVAYNFFGLTIEIPPGFEGPISAKLGEYTIVGFKKPNGESGTAAFFSVFRMPAAVHANALDEAEKFSMTSSCVSQLLDPMARRMANYHVDPSINSKTGAIYSTKAHFSGEVRNGLNGNGYIYCLAKGKDLYGIQIKDVGTSATPSMTKVAQAVEHAEATPWISVNEVRRAPSAPP